MRFEPMSRAFRIDWCAVIWQSSANIDRIYTFWFGGFFIHSIEISNCHRELCAPAFVTAGKTIDLTTSTHRQLWFSSVFFLSLPLLSDGSTKRLHCAHWTFTNTTSNKNVWLKFSVLEERKKHTLAKKQILFFSINVYHFYWRNACGFKTPNKMRQLIIIVQRKII